MEGSVKNMVLMKNVGGGGVGMMDQMMTVVMELVWQEPWLDLELIMDLHVEWLIKRILSVLEVRMM
jgi:hypothetical protein